MLVASLITFREGLEAALIVGIVLGYLAKIGAQHRARWAWGGVLAAALASLLVAWAFQFTGAQLEGQAEQVFEGATMLLAVVVLTWMIFWMRYQAHALKRALEQDIQIALEQGHGWGLFGLTFLAVFREGVETALFLSAATFASSAQETLWGGLLGLALAIAIGWLIYSSTVRLDLRRFFDVTSALLLLFAAGLMAHGVHELQEAGILPVLVEHVWDINWLLDERSTLGSMLKALFGYNGNPSLLEVLSYVGYWLAVWRSVKWWTARRLARLEEQQIPSLS